MFSLLEVSRSSGVAIIELRNGKVNALSNALMSELGTVLASISSDNEVSAIVIRGSDRAFSGVLYAAFLYHSNAYLSSIQLE